MLAYMNINKQCQDCPHGRWDCGCSSGAPEVCLVYMYIVHLYTPVYSKSQHTIPVHQNECTHKAHIKEHVQTGSAGKGTNACVQYIYMNDFQCCLSKGSIDDDNPYILWILETTYLHRMNRLDLFKQKFKIFTCKKN